jgi:phage baseplate assembly protein W
MTRRPADAAAMPGLERWEPRVQLTSVQVTRERDRGENVLSIRLRYNIISANVLGNNVIALLGVRPLP